MIRLRICAFGALVITCTASYAQDGPVDVDAATMEMAAAFERTGGIRSGERPIVIGQDKASPLCPTFCVPRRVTSPEQASVGEREAMTVTMAVATGGPKFHVDSRRPTFAGMEKLPGAAPAFETPIVATQSEFRPALDPVLAEPTTEPVE